MLGGQEQVEGRTGDSTLKGTNKLSCLLLFSFDGLFGCRAINGGLARGLSRGFDGGAVEGDLARSGARGRRAYLLSLYRLLHWFANLFVGGGVAYGHHCQE
jgi:hypothetical protein